MLLWLKFVYSLEQAVTFLTVIVTYFVCWLRFTAIHISGSTYVEKNQRLVLSCNASSDSYPPDDLDWFLNGIKVESNERAGVTITKRMTYRSKTIWSELIIEHAQMQNAGTYICRTSDQLITNIKVNVLNGE